MKIALAQLNYTVGDIEQNTKKICEAIAHAKLLGADLVVFAELALCGYPPHDLLTYPYFIGACDAAILQIAKQCVDIYAIVGAPSRNTSARGKSLYNSAYVLGQGKIIDIRHKSLLPDYDVFDEYRYFEPNPEPKLLNIDGKKIALCICEDLWEIGSPSLYLKQPMERKEMQGADFIINIAASPFNTAQANNRKAVALRNAQAYQLPIYYVNQVGANTDLIFDGGSFYSNAQGAIVQELAYFEEEVRLIDTQTTQIQEVTSAVAKIEYALVLGIRDYFTKMGFNKAILGLSGGIDSAVVAVLAVKALGADNVTGVLMPSVYSSEHSISDAEALAKSLACKTMLLPIKKVNEALLESLAAPFEGTDFGLTEENIQARIRGTMLMALSNKFGAILLNTTNKSEAAVGYGTLYGDMCGGLGVLGDVYKTEVYELARYLNRNSIVIPENTISKAPSAELRPEQKDSDSLPDYAILDEIIRLYLEEQHSADVIVENGFDAITVNKVLKLINNNEYKRYQAAPYLRISNKAFGYGRKMPLVAKYF